MQEIINKVQQSGLVEFDLEEFYDNSERVCIDMKDYLTAIPIGSSEAYILKEKTFREKLNQLELAQFNDKLVAITCSVDAIVPTWAYMLFTIAITPNAKRIIIGSLETLETLIFNEALSKINVKQFENAKVIIKGCSNFNVPIHGYAQISAILKPYVKSIMYGEPCSTVPLYKRSK
jgi:hypothetical protein